MAYLRFSNGLFNRWVYITIFFSNLFLVLAFTLYPYNFCFKEIDSGLRHEFYILGWGESHILDIQKNLFLFLPLGFGLAGYLMQRTKLIGMTCLTMIIVICSGLSYSIEVLQTFLPSRFPSLIDVLLNCAGGILGFIFFLVWKHKVIGCTSVVINKNIYLGFAGYAIFTILISASLQHFSSLSNWDKAFPLILGNERTGDRPWQGYMSKLYIADRAFTETEVADAFSDNDSLIANEDTLLALYQFAGPGDNDKKMGNFPDLVWKGEPQDVQQGMGIFLDSNHWLETTTPAECLTQNIIETSQFTLGVTVATSETIQTGPARIISLSGDTDHRNFTLGQQGRDLVFRLRTYFTGENGSRPQLIIPNIFSTKNPHNLVITYSGSVFRLYVDDVSSSYTVRLNPGVILFNSLFHLKAYSMMGYKILYYAYYIFAFVPLGILIASAVKIMKGRFIIKMLIAFGCILLPPFILEGILVSVSGRVVSMGNLLISMIFMTGPVVFLRVRDRTTLQS